jgi:hypothetical protein
MALLVMDYATKEDHDWTKCWKYMALLMQIGLETWITKFLQVGMCLTCLEEKSSWMRKIQFVVALSTTKVEYMVATPARKEALWLQIFCSGIGLVKQVVRIYCDS